jgi:hypothetical protein
MTTTQPKLLANAVGERLRYSRESCGARQEEVATAARRWGLPWTRATVAGIETGRRRLSLEEFLLLPFWLGSIAVKRKTGRRVVELADVIPKGEWLVLAPRTYLASAGVRKILRGRAKEVATTEANAPGWRRDEATFHRLPDSEKPIAGDGQEISRHVWPGVTAEKMGEARTASQGETEQKAARKVGVPPLAIALAALREWGKSLTEMRDQEVGAQIGHDESPRRVQAARGHVTRALLKRLHPLVEPLARELTVKKQLDRDRAEASEVSGLGRRMIEMD